MIMCGEKATVFTEKPLAQCYGIIPLGSNNLVIYECK